MAQVTACLSRDAETESMRSLYASADDRLSLCDADSLPIALLRVSAQGVVRYANRAAERFCGATAAALRGQSAKTVLGKWGGDERPDETDRGAVTAHWSPATGSDRWLALTPQSPASPMPRRQ